MGVKLEGFNEFMTALKRAGDKNSGMAASTARKLAGQCLERFYENTPYRDYELPETPVKRIPGDLRRGWTDNKEADPYEYGRTLPLKTIPGGYSVELENKAYFASWVEYGHKQNPGQYVKPINNYLVRDRVPGVFFMTKTAVELEGEMEGIVRSDLTDEAREYFNDYQ